MVLGPPLVKEECVEFGGSSRRPFPTSAPRPNKPVMMRERSTICKLPSLAGRAGRGLVSTRSCNADQHTVWGDALICACVIIVDIDNTESYSTGNGSDSAITSSNSTARWRKHATQAFH